MIGLLYALSGPSRWASESVPQTDPTPHGLPQSAPAMSVSAPSAPAPAVSQMTASVPISAYAPSPTSTMSDAPVVATSRPTPLDQLDAPTPSAVDGLMIPVVGVQPADLTDTFTDARSQGRVHDAIDIMAARGTPVVATNDGRVVKLFTSERGGLTVYQFDPQDEVVYYYAHLDSYAPGLAEGQVLRRGDPIGVVGSTGNASADAPHLHFEIEVLGPEKQWWHATSINPYGRFSGQQ